MSKRSVITASFEVRLRVPPGSSTKVMLEYIRAAIVEHKAVLQYSEPSASLDVNSMIIKLLRRETVYL